MRRMLNLKKCSEIALDKLNNKNEFKEKEKMTRSRLFPCMSRYIYVLRKKIRI